MNLERAFIPDETFTAASERGEIANDNGPEQKRPPELKLNTSSERELVSEGETIPEPEKEPTFEDKALAIAMEKHGGRAEEWKANTDFAEWNKNFIREDGEIVDHRGISVMESAMKDPKGTESVEFKRFLEVQEYLKNEANIGVPIYSGDYKRVVDGKEIYQVTSAVRHENGEIEYLPLEYTKELVEENKDDGEDDAVLENSDEGNVAEQGISMPFVTIEDDGSMTIDLTAALQSEQEEKQREELEETEMEGAEIEEAVVAVVEVVPPVIAAEVVEQKVLRQKISPQMLSFNAPEVGTLVQESETAEVVAEVEEVVGQEQEDVPEVSLEEVQVGSQKAVVLAREEVASVVEPIFVEEGAPLVREEISTPVFVSENSSVPQAETSIVANDFIEVQKEEPRAEDFSLPVQEVVRDEVIAKEVVQARVDESEREEISETVAAEAVIERPVSFLVTEPVHTEMQEEIVQELSVEITEVRGTQEEEIIEIIETKEEKVLAEEETEPVMHMEKIPLVQEKIVIAGVEIPKAVETVESVVTEQETAEFIPERSIERAVEFVPALSVDESSEHSKESPFVVYENELQLRDTTERAFNAQESERAFAGIPDSGMSSANSVAAANDNLEEVRDQEPEPVGEVTQNGITLNLRDAA